MEEKKIINDLYSELVLFLEPIIRTEGDIDKVKDLFNTVGWDLEEIANTNIIDCHIHILL